MKWNSATIAYEPVYGLIIITISSFALWQNIGRLVNNFPEVCMDNIIIEPIGFLVEILLEVAKKRCMWASLLE